MLGLSLYVPWGKLVVGGWKRYETRTRYTKVRGWVAIHSAGAKVPLLGKALMRSESYGKVAHWTGVGADQATCGPDGSMPTHCFLGFARVVACQKVEAIRGTIRSAERDFGDWSDGRFCYDLRDPIELLHRVPAKGRQGWFGVKPAEAELLHESLRHSGVTPMAEWPALISALERAARG